MERQEVVIAMPEVGTKKYRQNVREIQEAVSRLNGFTLNLEAKVANMLKGQETEFVNSYRVHMSKVEQALKDYQTRIDQYQQKIEHLENQGALAALIAKVAFLESHQKKLLSALEKKDRTISLLKTDIHAQKSEINSLQQRLRDQLRANPSPPHNEIKDARDSQQTFPTALQTLEPTLRSQQSLDPILGSSALLRTLPNPQDPNRSEMIRARGQVANLKRRNRELSAVNSKMIEKSASIEEFFLRTVSELKRKVSARKNFAPCTLQEFRQEDKLELLVKVLSHDEVLQYLYQKIFRRQAVMEQPHLPAITRRC